jgi:uncharacterized metal-binding protein
MILFVVFQYSCIPFTISWIIHSDQIEHHKKGMSSVIVFILGLYLALVAHSVYEKIKKEKDIKRTMNSSSPDLIRA